MKKIIKSLFLLIISIYSANTQPSSDININLLSSRKGPSFPHEDRGLYAVWYMREPEVLNLPYISPGEQLIFNWNELNPEEGKYDFSKLDEKLKEIFNKGYKTSLQVNGLFKPLWLYEKVPYHPQILAPQMARSEKGTLMYWHPAYIKAHTDFIEAWAVHLKNSEYKSAILGIRQNFNAMGTEYTMVPEEYRSIDQWYTPPGVEKGIEYTEALRIKYMKAILSSYIRNMSDSFTVFVRNNISKELREDFEDMWENGTLAWFHTSSEIEPRMNEWQYQTFLDYCKTGKTLGYAEQWSNAWGWHGLPFPDTRWTSPPQSNYWRLLCDLHCGISIITVYGSDLRIAIDGVHQLPWSNVTDEKTYPEYIDEFDKAFRFAAKYAGYASSPAESPGAWIAFRHSDINKIFNSPLKIVKGDYTFHIERLDSIGSIEELIGPDNQRFGAWALKLPLNEKLHLSVNKDFVSSLKDKPAKLKIIYLDSGKGSLYTVFGTNKYKLKLCDTQEWKTAEFLIKKSESDINNIISVSCKGLPVFLHMLEIEKIQ